MTRSFVPKYKSIYNELLGRINSGVYAAGVKMPTEAELCREFDVERVTVRRALKLLDDDGLITRQAGAGTFVAPEAGRAAGGTRSILFSMHRNQNDIRHNVNAFNAMLFFIMEQLCRDRGYSLLYTSVSDTDEQINWLERSDTVGALLISYHSDALLKNALALGKPIVCVNHYTPDTLCVMPDNHGGVRQAIARLRQLGHSRIGFISGPLFMRNAQERLSGYRLGLLENGLEYDPELVTESDWTYDGGRDAMLGLMKAQRRPTAVYAASDMMAIGAMEGARQSGLSVPRDVSVIGFDNIDMGSYCTPALTTVAVSARQISHTAVESIVRFADKGCSEFDRYTIRIPAGLVERGSAAAAPENN